MVLSASKRVSVNGDSKIINPGEFQSLRETFKKQGLTVIQCHGVFDLLHPGHIAHLEEAKTLGDILVVTVTSAPFVNKGPGRPHFSDELRLKTLAALQCVDFVLLSEAQTALNIIEIVQPDLYVKGKEYAASENDVTENIDLEAAKVRFYGGDIYFTDGEVFSSTKLLNNNFPVFPPHVREFAQEFASRHSFNEIREIVDSMQTTNVLVIGDIIIDEYVFCKVQGLMSKDRAFSAVYEREERYLGGALAIANHLASFSKNVTVCGIVGDEPLMHSQILNGLGRSMLLDFLFDPGYQTPVKRRFIEQRGIRKEYDKLFSINYLDEKVKENKEIRESFHNKLAKTVPGFDLVVLADYGHGLLDGAVMDIIQDKAKFLSLNCQTNSTNYGTNLITKYRRADSFVLDQAELRLAYADRFGNEEKLLPRLMNHLQAQMGWLTLGSVGSVNINQNSGISRTPALTLQVQDTVGAGDAFFALSSLCAQKGVETEIGAFLGNIAGAQAANVLGNSKAVSKAELLKFSSTLLNF